MSKVCGLCGKPMDKCDYACAETYDGAYEEREAYLERLEADVGDEPVNWGDDDA